MEDIKKNILPIVITGLLLFPAGLITGRAIAEDSSETTKTETTHSEESHSDGDSHAHEMYEVEATNAPAISNLSVTEDSKAGWNVSFDTSNFTFAPQNASSAGVDGEGHAHLYVNGEKIARIYSSDFHIDSLEQGENTIRVTLNTNDHKDYAVNGAVIEASTTVTEEHDHSDDESHSHSEDSHSHEDGESHSHSEDDMHSN